MTVRLALADDEIAARACLQEAAELSAFTAHHEANEQELTRLMADLIRNPDAIIALAERAERVVGLCILVVHRCLWSGVRQAGQICWYVTKRERGHWAGIRLLTCAMHESLARGVTTMEMIAPLPIYERVLERYGFCAQGRVYRRVESCQSRS